MARKGTKNARQGTQRRILSATLARQPARVIVPKAKPGNWISTKEEFAMLCDSMETDIGCELSTHERAMVNGRTLEIVEIWTDGRRHGAYYVNGKPVAYADAAKECGIVK